MQIRLHRERSLKGTSAFHFLETKTSQRRYETELAEGECECTLGLVARSAAFS